MATKMDYFSYTDAHGTEVIVQHLGEVPSQYRAQAKHIDLSKPALTPRGPDSRQAPPQARQLCLPGQAACFHWPSVAFGAALALALGLVAVFLLRRASRWFWTLVGLAAITGLAGAYLGYIRNQAGLSRDRFATPGALLDDARQAVKAAKARDQAQERVLREVEQQR